MLSFNTFIHPYRDAGRIIAVLFGLIVSAMSATAQVTIPPVSVVGDGRGNMPMTAAEIENQIAVEWEKATKTISFRRPDYPKDSILAAVSATSAQWFKRLQSTTVSGIQHEPAGYIGASARQVEYAKAHIAERLATAGLSRQDKAFTYFAAIWAFTSEYFPERLPIAEGYLSELDAMGDSAATWQFWGRRVLIDVYYRLGRSADIVRLGTRAITLATIMPFVDRGLMFPPLGDYVYLPTVMALSGLPNAQGQIDQLNTALRAAIGPPPDLIRLDSAFEKLGRDYGERFDRFLRVGKVLGTRGKPLVAHRWLNRPSADSATIVPSDGKIRLVEVAGWG